MKALIQRVMNAKVAVNDEVVSSIEQGLCVLIGISKNDKLSDMEYIVENFSATKKILTQLQINASTFAKQNLIKLFVLIKEHLGRTRITYLFSVRKILSIRLFNDDSEKRWSKSIVDKDFEVLCVSQFTLYNTWKGNKPDFHNAMGAEDSKKFYEQFLQLLKDSYKPDKIKDGVFGAYMQVSIQNDGPVTLEIESPAKDEKTLAKEARKPQRVKANKESEGDLNC